MPLLPDLGLLIVLAAGLATGTLIGAVGVGGVLLAPLLVLLAGYEPHAAVAIASWSFLFTGIAGTYSYARRGSVDWRAVAWLVAAIIPAALAGAWVNTLFSASAVTLILAVLALGSGLRELLSRPAGANGGGAMPSGPMLLLLGTLVGFGSALTGTGGPVLLVPLLLLFSMPPLAAVGVAQVVQLPVATFASLGYLLFGDLDLTVGTVLGVIQAVGVVMGARIAHSLPQRTLR